MYASNPLDPAQQPVAAQIDSFDWLFRKYFSALVLFARKLTHDRSAAEDIVSGVFCKLWQKQIRFESENAAKAYLYISTRNACINHLERMTRQEAVKNKLRQEARDQYEDHVLNQIIGAEVSRLLVSYLDRLPPECRKIMRMSFIQGYSNREIAGRLQLSINTVRNQRARGIHLIRKRRGAEG
jgi:RNA polymerase sigma-70 factor (family 1)